MRCDLDPILIANHVRQVLYLLNSIVKRFNTTYGELGGFYPPFFFYLEVKVQEKLGKGAFLAC